jgi:multimeric flavodoxin WrbA
MTAEKIGGEIEEFFLPKDFNAPCIGCYLCMDRGMELCSHYSKTEPIFSSMLAADIIIIDSPTYVMEMTGQLKSFFDHLFVVWLSHRPEKAMFSKTAVAISTAAGMGMGGVTKSIAKQCFFLGIPKVYRIPVRVAATSWKMVKKKEQISAKVDKIARKIVAGKNKARPGIKLRFMFSVMRLMHKRNDWATLDRKYWEEQQWLGKERPWKNRIDKLN